MTPLLFALVQASWQGAVFAVLVGAVCRLRLSAFVRAFLWMLVAVKFVVGFLWLLFFGTDGTVGIAVPASLAFDFAPTFALFLSVAWGIGAVLCATIILLRIRDTYRRVRGAKPATSPTLQHLIGTLAARFGLAPYAVPPVRTIVSGENPQVTLHGAKPVILLPADLLPPSPVALSPSDLRLLLAHELAHIRRGDLWVGWLFLLMQTLFFFHPCAVWAKHEWEAAREEACDSFALQIGDADDSFAARYGALLLKIGGTSPASNAVGAAFLAASPFAILRRRLQHLEQAQTAPTIFARCGAAVTLLVFTALLLPLHPRPIAPSVIAVAVPTVAPTRWTQEDAPLTAAQSVAPPQNTAIAPPRRKAITALRPVAIALTVTKAKRKPSLSIAPRPVLPPVKEASATVPTLALAEIKSPPLAVTRIAAPPAPMANPTIVTPDMPTMLPEATLSETNRDIPTDTTSALSNTDTPPTAPAFVRGVLPAARIRAASQSSKPLPLPESQGTKPLSEREDVPPSHPR